MEPEELKLLSEGGAWVFVAGVLLWLIRHLLQQAAVDRREQDKQHRSERASILLAHRAERRAWNEASERAANKLAESVERALRHRP